MNKVESLLEAICSSIGERALISIAAYLSKKDTGESWKLVDSIVEYQIQNVGHPSIVDDLAALLDDENGNLRDLGATYVAKIDENSVKKYRDRTWMLIKHRILDTYDTNLDTGERDPDATLPSRGINDEHQYAQLRSVIAAMEHNWLSQKQWVNIGKPVLNKNLDNMKDVVEPYLKKGKELYETITSLH